ncbi:YcnI family protein [Phenylobacterium sp.]|uniref:YcnI family copper-binding membrane protein n=1 Tax=Phenylobacterium sp. TaxID=1871053 RepID=UPI0030F3B07A
MALLKPLLLTAALAAATPGLAHVSVDPGEAGTGAYQALRFRVGHGCGTAATTALRIETPAGLASARPQPKLGWTLTIEKDGARVSALVWRGELPADQFDEFAVLAKLPAEPGVLYFPTVQTCGGDESQWTQIPDPGETGLSHPAPSLRVLPAAAVSETPQH